jgi:aromatic ring-opening dioxygenase LigB subunit
MFINLLQGLHPLEAEIICLIKDKKLEEKYKITKEVVAEAYPDISWGGRS